MDNSASPAGNTAGKYAFTIEKGFCYTFFALMVFLPVVNILLRPFNIVIPNYLYLITRFFLVVGFLAAMLTTRAKEHISIGLIQYSKNEKLKQILSCLTGFVSAIVATVLFWNSISFIKFSLLERTTGNIHDWVFALVMPIAYGVMAFRFAFYAVPAKDETEKLKGQSTFKVLRILPVIVILLGTALALPAVAKIIWGFEPPGIFFNLVNKLYDIALYAKTPLILFFVIAALSGTSIFTAIGGIALVMLQAAGGEPDAAPIQIHSALTDMDIIAIPLFTLTGFFLSESKAGERLVSAFRCLFGWLPGGMIIATVIICAFFTSFTGASGVTILALGGILYAILSGKLGYPSKFSIGLLASAGSVGLLFPPSLPIILVAALINNIIYFMGGTVNYRIIDYFLGGIIPGFILILAMITAGIIASMKVKIPVEPFKIKEAGTALKGSALEILLPIVLITGYFSGILSLVETSAVSVIYVFIVEVLIHRDIPVKDVIKVFAKAAPIVGGILAIIAVAKVLSYAIIGTHVPEQLAQWMQSAVESRYLFLLLLNLALLVLGCLMDIFSAILVALPLVVPLGVMYGIDPVHLGIIFIINLEVGYITPPFGLNLFLASYRFGKPFAEICRYALPFLAIRFAVLLLVTYLPALSTFLPRVFG